MPEIIDPERHYEKYIDFAYELLTDPEQGSPTARSMLDRFGGSMTTANKAMQVFWRHLGQRLSYEQQYPDGMPLEVIKQMQTLMASARKTAKEELATEREEMASREAEMKNQLAILKTSLDDLQNQNTELHQQKTHLEENLAAKEVALESTQGKVNQATDQLAKTEQTLADAIQHCESIQQSLDASVIDNNCLNDDIKKLFGEIETHKSNHAKLESDNAVLVERLTHATDSLAALKTENYENRSTIKIQSDKIMDIKDQLMAESTRRSTAETSIVAAQQNTARLEKQNQELQEKLQKADVLLTDEMSEKQHLLIKCERLEGFDVQLADLREERDRLISMFKPHSSSPEGKKQV